VPILVYFPYIGGQEWLFFKKKKITFSFPWKKRKSNVLGTT